MSKTGAMTSEILNINDLLPILAATKTLESAGVISKTKARQIRQQVRESALCLLETYSGQDDVQRIANEAYREAH